MQLQNQQMASLFKCMWVDSNYWIKIASYKAECVFYLIFKTTGFKPVVWFKYRNVDFYGILFPNGRLSMNDKNTCIQWSHELPN